jgi:ubiquinone/menaquinone biosynthesis C-methylase UbiE
MAAAPAGSMPLSTMSYQQTTLRVMSDMQPGLQRTPSLHRPPAPELERRQRIEIEFWRESHTERPESNAVENIVNKAADAAIFLELVDRFRDVFGRARTILEIGAGQGWASCLVKRLFPSAEVTASDISQYAVASVGKWERIYETRLDSVRVCSSYELKERDASVDLVFCFAAAHHFVAHRRTLAEIARVLVPGGHALYLYEPSCRAYVHAFARHRVNRNRPDVPEDVLVYDRIVRIAREVGLGCELDFFPSTKRRAPIETLYYALLQRMLPLQRLLPCTINYHFRKP